MQKLSIRKFLVGGLICAVLMFVIYGMTSVVLNSSNIPSQNYQYNQLWVRIAAIYEGNAGDKWNIPKETLETIASSFINKPVLLGHDMVNPYVRVGTIIDSGMRFDGTHKQWYIEMICTINDDVAIDRIHRKLFDSVSIGFQIDEIICSIDSLDMRLCPHVSGKWYNINNKSELAVGTIKKAKGLEVSFINVPASPHAKIIEFSNRPLHLLVGK